ncbi:MAG: YdcF family protein [Alphaproteobacteria bacterium]|nr:MAG: YdcF family protein [Alphaproteobacteria bacterium]
MSRRIWQRPAVLFSREGSSVMFFYLKGIVTVIFIVGSFWTGAFLTFIDDIRMPALPAAAKAGGIVILTGTPARLTAGFELLNEGAGERLLVSGVNSKVTRETLRHAVGQTSEQMNCCVDLGRIARNTEGNAFETMLWARAHDFKSLLIVTSAYHMPRSLVELKRQMPDIKLIAYPVANDTLEPESWWQKPHSLVTVAGEFNKYVFSLVRARLEQPKVSDPS